MFWPITTMLGVLWLLGLLSGYTLSGAVHLLLVGAFVMLLVNLISGRKQVL